MQPIGNLTFSQYVVGGFDRTNESSRLEGSENKIVGIRSRPLTRRPYALRRQGENMARIISAIRLTFRLFEALAEGPEACVELQERLFNEV